MACDVMSRRVSTMFPCTYVPRYLCSPNLCSPIPMFPGTDVPRTYVPRYLCSQVPIYVPRTYVPRFTANMLDVVIGIGILSELFDKQYRCVNGRAYIAETPTHTHARTHAHTYKKKIDTALNVPFSDGTLPYCKPGQNTAIIISTCSDKKISLGGVLLITVLSLTANRGT